MSKRKPPGNLSKGSQTQPTGRQLKTARPTRWICQSFRGTKFTAKVEQIKGESFLGLKARANRLQLEVGWFSLISQPCFLGYKFLECPEFWSALNFGVPQIWGYPGFWGTPDFGVPRILGHHAQSLQGFVEEKPKGVQPFP